MKKIKISLVILMLLLACNLPTQGGGGDIDVDAGAGTTPAYYWDGAVCSLVVYRTANLSRIVWGITTSDLDNITSPYFQGEVKSGATRIANVESVLTCGIEYRVRVVGTNGVFGWREFTPSTGNGG